MYQGFRGISVAFLTKFLATDYYLTGSRRIVPLPFGQFLLFHRNSLTSDAQHACLHVISTTLNSNNSNPKTTGLQPAPPHSMLCANADVSVLRTDLQGDIVIKSDGINVLYLLIEILM